MTQANATPTSITTTALTLQNDTVDALCWRLYGDKVQGSNIVEQVLELNPRLADLGEVLPMGLTLIVPVLTTTPQHKEVIQLWT